MSNAVVLDNVTLSYLRVPAVHHVSGAFAAGSLTAVAGPNGGGKSTLLKGIAGIMRSDQGDVRINGTLGYLPQVVQLQRDFPMTVQQMVATGSWPKTGGFGAITPELRKRAMEALSMVGLADMDKRAIGELSTGQFQRVLFARLIMQDADVLLLDEPFNAIDDETTAALVEIILRWHKEGRTVICVLHDLEQIKRYFPQCLLLAKHCVAWGDSKTVLTAQNLASAGMRRTA